MMMQRVSSILIYSVVLLWSCRSVFGWSVTRSNQRNQKTALLSTKINVDGVQCIQVPIQINGIGTIKVLEATAEAQEELVNRVLLDDISNSLITDPYGAVLWPAAAAVAKYCVEQNLIKNRTLLELGTGTGLVSLTCAMGGAKLVIATDYESLPLQLLDYAAKHLNPNSQNQLVCRFFDICDDELDLPQVDILLAADVLYEPRTGRGMAQRVVQALKQGTRVIVGDSPGRAGRAVFVQELTKLGVPSDFRKVQGWTITTPRHDLICGKDSTTISIDQPRQLLIDILDLHPDCLYK